ncbi:MAG: hypothetical protein DRH44_07545 [Candidatus Coatesbacteria bacterium]|nr:MAG: hypothetical protein DRH44_07545 [Candidatus Coatesbacteria bacterium]
MSKTIAGLSVETWERRFSQQFHWSLATRKYIYRLCNLARMDSILDIGCGCGQITNEIANLSRANVVGIDVEPHFIGKAKSKFGENAHYTVADGLNLPYKDESFDGVFCHLYLHWLKDIEKGISEMRRVVKKTGYIAIMMEPDYGGWIMEPDLPDMRRAYIKSIEEFGHNPYTGRQLMGALSQAGLSVEMRLHNYIRKPSEHITEFQEEWEFRKAMFKNVRNTIISENTIKMWFEIEYNSLKSGKFFSYIPFFYVISRRV